MHLGNSIICPYTMTFVTAVSGAAVFYSIKKAREKFKKEDIFKAVSLTLFVFALQMINFTIPMTHSSGHIIGGVLLASLLGQEIGFLSMCLILFTQACLLGDGSLGALGYNIFNMGFIASFVIYPLFFKLIKNKNLFLFSASFAAVIFGALSVIFETAFINQNVSNLILFAFYMISIHSVIAAAEGLFSTVAFNLIEKNRIDKSLILALSIFFTLCALKISSSFPDGLAWAQNKALVLNSSEGELFSIPAIYALLFLMFFAFSFIHLILIKKNERKI